MQPQSTQLTQGMQTCIQNCEDCHRICMKTVQYCLTLGSEHANPNHIGLLLDCADICATSADYMLRSSPRHQDVCRVCAEVCYACAQDCESLGGDDRLMMECATICRSCGDCCREMAGTR